jgi:hypothetical protein
MGGPLLYQTKYMQLSSYQSKQARAQWPNRIFGVHIIGFRGVNPIHSVIEGDWCF